MATLISKPDVIEFINALWGDQSDAINIESFDYNELPATIKGRSIAEITGLTPANIAMKVHRIKKVLAHRVREEKSHA